MADDAGIAALPLEQAGVIVNRRVNCLAQPLCFIRMNDLFDAERAELASWPRPWGPRFPRGPRPAILDWTSLTAGECAGNSRLDTKVKVPEAEGARVGGSEGAVTNAVVACVDEVLCEVTTPHNHTNVFGDVDLCYDIAKVHGQEILFTSRHCVQFRSG